MAEITVNHWNSKGEKLSVRLNSELVEIAIRYANRIRMEEWMNITYADAHKVADWIKENIPEPPPAPPEWRIVIGEERVALMIGLVSMGVIGSDGIVRDYGISEYDGVTPELHKEMICALLDAHYELHKGES